MKQKCRVVVKKVVYEELKSCPFPSNLSLREISRRTGIDVGYLSRVKNGEMAITEDNLSKIEKALALVVA